MSWENWDWPMYYRVERHAKRFVEMMRVVQPTRRPARNAATAFVHMSAFFARRRSTSLP
jgi:hypothetical protein